MAEGNAKRGEVYRVDRTATYEHDPKQKRPMMCVAEQRLDPDAWKAMGRTTTPEDPSAELMSPMSDLSSFTKDGLWSYRRLRSVKKSVTGDNELCKYLGRLQETLETEVLAHYMSRPQPSNGGQ